MNILIIEDDHMLGKRISDVFYEKVVTNRINLIHSFEEFMEEYSSIDLYDIILTDLNLWNYKAPQWFEIIKKIRELHKTVPIIVISGYDDIEKMRYAFSIWISDYIIKPVRLKELEIRVLNWFHTHYTMKLVHVGNILTYKDITFDIDKNIFFYKETKLSLSKKSKYILSLFFSNPDKILSERFLCEKVWGDIIYSEKRNIRICIFRLKKRLAIYGIDNWIENVHSEWYIFKESSLS
jgi:two-component system OmpR family response regulator